MDHLHRTRSDRYCRYARICSLAVILIACVVLTGWIVNIPDLVTLKPGFYQMKVNTAFGLLLAAVALWAGTHWQHRPVLARVVLPAALGAAAIGAGTLIEHAFAINLGIDQALWPDLISSVHDLPGRPSAPTAGGLLLAGITLLGLRTSARSWPMFLAAVSLAGWLCLALFYAYGLTSVYRFDAYGSIAIPTIASFAFINAGILFAHAQRGFMFYFTNPSYAGLAARRLLPAAYLLPALLGWLVLSADRFGNMDIRAALAAEAFFIALLFTALIGWSARSLVHLERLASIRQSEKLEALERAARLAHYDALTGLANRMLLQERLTESVKAAARRHSVVALLFIDLDRFKPINDTHGHRAGDEVLVEIATRLKAAVRDTDTVARLGGDEFVVLMNEVRRPDDAASTAAKLIDCIEQPYLIESQETFLSASIGVATYPDHATDAAGLMERADAAMYYAKSLGKRNYQFYAPQMTHEAVRRASVERQLRAALVANGFTLAYQPKIAIASGRLIGFEALVRMKPVDGREGITPDQFIPIAEESGLIVQLGAWVLNEACRQNRAWQEAGYLPLPVSVNVSAVQFRSREFVGIVRAALAESGLNPTFLDLEITETTVMQDFEHGIDVMRQLQALGVTVSIDDFGTGSSSLSKLKLFSADTLKIDRSFIRDLPHDRDDAAITSTIIDLARNLDQKVVAEGVETKEQLAFLQHHGCDAAQGFFFSPPLSPVKFEALYGKQW
ncbi:EAL domain-containing protein [Oxalobacteraceae bacterium OM1]|nr:EAL domain-containing protein [Oxalobacteraceae bacterium OM1]